MDEQHIEDMLDAYALGALEPSEIIAVDAHLAVCAHCRLLAAEAQSTVYDLHLSAPLVRPLPSLKSRILAHIRAQGPQASLPSGDPMRHSPREFSGVYPMPPEENPAMRLARLLASRDCAIWNINGIGEASIAYGRLVGIPNGREAVVVVSGLPELGAARAYQIWLLRSSYAIPSATFQVDVTGIGQQIVRAPAALQRFDSLMITPEPDGGSVSPTGRIVLTGKIGK